MAGKKGKKNHCSEVKIPSPNNSKKYFFNDYNNLLAIDQLNYFMEKNDLEGCIIGGNAVSANYINYVRNKSKDFDLEYCKKELEGFSRQTSDIDIIINGKKPKNFEGLIYEYFGSNNAKIGNSNEIDIVIDKDSPYLSFHFVDDHENSQSEYFKHFVENANKLSFTYDKNKYSCNFANPLDLIVMKLKSCSNRKNEAKKKVDLFDLDILITKNKYAISDIKKRIFEIGYHTKYGDKIKNSILEYHKYILNNKDAQISSIKLNEFFESNADDFKIQLNDLAIIT